jgi:hypothetical protein
VAVTIPGRLAWALCAAAELTAVACVVLLVAGEVGIGDAVDAYLVTNLGMVVTFVRAVRGGRPDHGADVGLAVDPAPTSRAGTGHTFAIAQVVVAAWSRSRLVSPSSSRRVKRRRAAT